MVGSILLGLFTVLTARQSWIVAIPFLLLWSCAKCFCDWFDQPLPERFSRLSASDEQLLRETAERTWLFFESFSNERSNWLIPDHVWEEDKLCSHRTSPTNIGLLLDSRIAAHELGYFNLEEFISRTESTLATILQLRRYRGHLFNWYDVRTLQAEDPLFVSTVDSGNLAASLIALKQYCLTLADGDEKLEGESGTAIYKSAASFNQRKKRLICIAEQADGMISHMDFAFLYDFHRDALSVGYHLPTGKLFRACYDLLASEARTALFIAIAKGDLPARCWFNLGRAHTQLQNLRVLLSWSGTMFEYLMPSLWMKLFPGSLLENSARSAVRCQSTILKRLGRPWGYSECACSQRGPQGVYEYLALGVPELSLQPAEPTVDAVSPYSSFLALLVDPKSALRNIRHMSSLNWVGRYGFYEAAVFFRQDLDLKNKENLIRCWMSHHQGMILLAICNSLKGFKIQEMFHSETRVAAAERLLEERFPSDVWSTSHDVRTNMLSTHRMT